MDNGTNGSIHESVVYSCEVPRHLASEARGLLVEDSQQHGYANEITIVKRNDHASSEEMRKDEPTDGDCSYDPCCRRLGPSCHWATIHHAAKSRTKTQQLKPKLARTRDDHSCHFLTASGSALDLDLRCLRHLPTIGDLDLLVPSGRPRAACIFR